MSFDLGRVGREGVLEGVVTGRRGSWIFWRSKRKSHTMTWIIVKFLESEEVEAVPLIWYLKETSTLCYPNYKPSKVIRAIKCQEVPEDDWLKYKVTLMRNGERFHSFHIASNKAQKACLTSDISEAEHVIGIKRVPKKKVFSSDEEILSDSEGFSDPPPNVTVDEAPKEKSKCNSKAQEKLNTPGQSNKFVDVTYNAMKNTRFLDETELDDPDTKFKKTLLTLVHKIHKQLGTLEIKVDALSNKIDNEMQRQVTNIEHQEDWNKLYIGLPINSARELEEIEIKISSDQGLYDFLVDSLQRIGGTNFKEATRRIAKKFLSDKVAILYSLKGHKAKKSLMGLRCCELLLDSVQKSTKHPNRKEIEIALGIYLSKANERMKKETGCTQFFPEAR